jgi:hypothetical protein
VTRRQLGDRVGALRNRSFEGIRDAREASIGTTATPRSRAALVGFPQNGLVTALATL